MKVRFSINLGIWIGLTTAIYVWLYLMSPLAAGGVLPCSFIALPIFLNGGGKLEQMPNHLTSALLGVVWGLAYIKLSAVLSLLHFASSTALVIAVFIATSVLCSVHGIFKPFGLFCSIPMMFGAIASTFFAGADKWLYVMLTLCLGIVLGYVNISGARFLDENGRWMFLRNRMKRTAI
ncbi:DUF1097 domain-containing protein [Paraburkholderia tropica]|uniref:DUF1097 domain-containing protein n=1 Tax=Paraburkholderia tropica TaxID=92647 RepID=UPI002AB19C12|nr:DUF1097 domain-containing protein [Paraburkholderia tropica]